jgi:penicillin-binding protein 1A
VQQDKHKEKPLDMRLERQGCFPLFFLLMVCAGILWGGALGFFVAVLQEARTTIQVLEEFRPKLGSKVYSSDGELLGEFTTERRELVPLNEIPLHLQKAFIATEDDRFYEHYGVRPESILNAALYVLRTGRLRGGSTITQQVVRNVEPLQVGQEQSLKRKMREALVALQIERKFTKDEILELYLNQIFLGISAHGVEAASWQYFNKSCREVTLGEAAMLAGLARLPNQQEPFHHPENALKRRNIVLQQMLENGFITEEQYHAALAEDLDASVVTPEEREQMRKAQATVGAPSMSSEWKAPYFVEEVRKQVLAQYGKEQVFEDGLQIQTTLDMRLQRIAEEVLFKAMDEFDARKSAALKKEGRESEFVPIAGALVCLDNRPAYRGFVRAMVGGRNFEQQKFNHATQALRQPGSSIKPFVWAAAIESGFTPSTIVVDEPFVRSLPGGRLWAPKNFDGKYSGPVPIRHALEKSINIVSIKLTERVGVPMVRSYLERCGIRTPIDDSVGLTIALGTPLVTVLDHCVAYSTFANGGVRYDPVLITSIKSRDGLPRYEYRRVARATRAMPANVAYVMTNIMEGVCEPDYRNGFYPTGWRAKDLERPCAGKTGTTNDHRDVWFVGFTPQYTCAVWLGYSDNRPLGSGKEYTGGRIACPIWTEFMKRAHENLPVEDFEVPEGVQFYNINRYTGTLGGGWRQAFIAGTAPPTYESPQPRPAPPAELPLTETPPLPTRGAATTPEATPSAT